MFSPHGFSFLSEIARSSSESEKGGGESVKELSRQVKE